MQKILRKDVVKEEPMDDELKQILKTLAQGQTNLNIALSELTKHIQHQPPPQLLMPRGDAQLLPPQAPPAPQTKTVRCELCNDAFDTIPRFGTPNLCGECSQPGRVLVKCLCSKSFSVERTKVRMRSGKPEMIFPDGAEGPPKCKKCLACIVCGDKSSNDVCAECIINGNARICDGCQRLAMNNSAFCQKCDSEYKRKSAGNFAEVQNIDPDPRAMQEGMEAEMSGRTFSDGMPSTRDVQGVMAAEQAGRMAVESMPGFQRN